jgi:hypothetical protein
VGRGWFLLALVPGCDRGSPPAPADAVGILHASWTDSSRTADWRGAALASWCARDTMLELIGVRNDSSVGIALFLPDTLAPQSFPVFQSGVFAPWRPQATAALRLFVGGEIVGYESTWGQVALTGVSAEGLSGTLDLRVRRTQGEGSDSLHLTGGFERVPLQPADSSCGRAHKPVSP